MKQVLALAMRPTQFRDLIGQRDTVLQIRARIKQGRLPKAWMLMGETGAGKTTVARILALSLQCKHMVRFGNPCKACQRNLLKFDIDEINSSDVTGVDELREKLDGYTLTPSPGSMRRVYILDEAHGMSKHSMRLLYKITEDCPLTTQIIICTTEPEKILKPLRRRCAKFQIASLTMEDVEKLVKRAMEYAKCDYKVAPLVEQLWTNGITSSGLIVDAVEKYATGSTAEMAALEIGTQFDVYTLMRNVIKGDWSAVAELLAKAKFEDVAAIRRIGSHFLKSVILNDADTSDRNASVVEALQEIVRTSSMEDGLQLPALVGSMFNACKKFEEYKH